MPRKRQLDSEVEDEEFTIVSPSRKRQKLSTSNSKSTSKCEKEEHDSDSDEKDENDESDSSSQEDEDEDEEAKWSCNVIRNRLLKLRQTPDFKITAWLKENGVNSNSYQRFMKLKGTWNGTQNTTFWAATRYFKKQEKLKQKEKQKEKRKPAAQKKRDTAKKKKEKAEKDAAMDAIVRKIESVEKKDDYDDNGPVFDDCNDVRKKITNFMKRGICTQSRFLKEIGSVQSNSYHKFMKEGPLQLAGASNSTYYKAYHWFEKLRIAEKEAKSKKRLQNEEENHDGFPLRHDDGRRWVPMGFVPVRKKDKIAVIPDGRRQT